MRRVSQEAEWQIVLRYHLWQLQKGLEWAEK